MMHDGPEYPGNQHAVVEDRCCQCAPGGESWHHGREPPRCIASTYLDQNLSTRSPEQLVNADGGEVCATEGVAHLLLHSAAAVRCLLSGDVDACLALKSQVKGA